jgi:hypothetical protein
MFFVRPCRTRDCEDAAAPSYGTGAGFGGRVDVRSPDRFVAQRVLFDRASPPEAAGENQLGACPVQRLNALEKQEGSENPNAWAASETVARASSCSMASSLRTSSSIPRNVLPRSRNRRCSGRDATPTSRASMSSVTVAVGLVKTRPRNLCLIAVMSNKLCCCK